MFLRFFNRKQSFSHVFLVYFMVEFGLVALEGPRGHFLVILGVLLGSLSDPFGASRDIKYSVFDDFYRRSGVFSCVFEVLGEAFSQVAPRGTL